MKLKLTWLMTLLMAFVIQISYAQEKSVSGTITSATDGLPLSGVNVIVKGTTRGVQSDFDGNYTIRASANETLVFSFVGLKTVERNVGGNSTINVQMDEDAATLEEVVVVAYGVQKKEALTGSVAEIKTEEVAKISTSNVTQSLVGKVAGVQVTNNNGLPGEPPTIRIRGIGSLSASSDPLFVVDGVPFSGSYAINSINTQDIESMTVLKDAAATALYGSRGGNGVIIITTKRGKNNKSKVSLDSRAGFSSRAVSDYDFIKNEAQYYEAYYQMLKNTYSYNVGMEAGDAANLANSSLINGDQGLQYNSFVGSLSNDNLINTATGRLNPGAVLAFDEDWSDYLFGDGFFTQNAVSVSGGNDLSNHYLSIGYEKNEGYVVNSGFEKITARLRLDTKIGERFKIGGNLSYAYTKQDYLDGYTGGNTYSSPFFWVRAVAPIYPVRAYDFNGEPIINQLGQHIFDDGTGADGLSPIRPFGSLQHPYATAVNDFKREAADNIFATGYADFKIIDGLVFTYNIAGQLNSYFNWSNDTQLYGDAVNAGGRVTNSSSRTLSFTQSQFLKYNKSFGDHTFDVLLGHETLDRRRDFVSASRSKMLFDSPYVDHAALNQSNGGGGTTYSLEGFLSRLNYDFDNKYYLSASARRDGSSRFHADQRWGTFYGLGMAWRISQESFLQDVSWINELKIKGSFGQQGNDNIGYELPYLTPYEIVYTTDSTLDVAFNPVGYLGNPDIKWETSTNFNVGFNTSLFNSRLNFEAEYFERKITDMLFNRPLPPSSGFNTTPENIGDMQNTGFEVTISGEIVRTNDWTIGLHFNATTYENEVTKLPDNNAENNRIITGAFIREEGGGAYDYYLREFAGVNPGNGAALFWMDVDGDDPAAGRILTEDHGEADLYKIGKSALPDVYGGFGLNLGYKNFDLNVDFAYQMGGYGYDGVWMSGLSVAPGGGIHSDFANAWTPQNTSASLPRMDLDDPNNFYSTSTLGLIESDYLSVQNVSLGYTFNPEMTERIGLSKLRIYGLADNVFLWSKRKGYDPRQSGITGSSGNNYSLLRTMSFGFNIEF